MTPGARFQVFIDFDNTISRGDVLDAVIARFARSDAWRALEEDWVAGRIGARACLEGQVRNLRADWPAMESFLQTAELDPGFAGLVACLRDASVELTIVSDNFDRFIGTVLARHDFADLAVRANHVELVGDTIEPSFPYFDPGCPGCAHCKKSHFTPRRDERRVVYIGDGLSDVCPASRADLVFAKASLLRHRQRHGLPCRPFGDLSAVTHELRTILHENQSRG